MPGADCDDDSEVHVPKPCYYKANNTFGIKMGKGKEKKQVFSATCHNSLKTCRKPCRTVCPWFESNAKVGGPLYPYEKIEEIAEP